MDLELQMKFILKKIMALLFFRNKCAFNIAIYQIIEKHGADVLDEINRVE